MNILRRWKRWLRREKTLVVTEANNSLVVNGNTHRLEPGEYTQEEIAQFVFNVQMHEERNRKVVSTSIH